MQKDNYQENYYHVMRFFKNEILLQNEKFNLITIFSNPTCKFQNDFFINFRFY